MIAGGAGRSAANRGRSKLSAPARAGLLFVLPALVYIVLTQLLPVIYALYVSFTDYSPLNRGAPRWVGLQNYRAMIFSREFQNALWVTVRFSAAVIVLNVVISLALALLLEGASRALRWLQVVLFLPIVTSVAAVSVVWLLLYDRDFGLLNQILNAFGLSNVGWLNTVAWALPSLVIMRVWRGAGWNTVIYRAALQGVPREVIEAAKVDGASAFQLFRQILLPLLRPITAYIVIVGLISTLQTFAEIYILTSGGPLGSTTTVGFLIYRQAFEYGQLGLACATSFVLFVVIFALSFGSFALARKGMT
ncbi:MAG: sugar ABC transporter permease [Trueperaceae bacterium]|nr:sugar ABC transporter permease [Trueperaceae bacterium]